MVFYLSNRFTNPIMFGIILKSYRKISVENITFYLLKSVQDIINSPCNYTFVPFGRQQCGTVVIRVGCF